MRYTERSELIQLRVSPEMKEQIRELATENGYEAVSEFILDLINNKMKNNVRYDEIRAAVLKTLNYQVVSEKRARVGKPGQNRRT